MAGEQLALPLTGRALRDEARFLAKIVHQGECWKWTGARSSNGYGNFAFEDVDKRKTVSVHRYSYELFVGAVPEGLQLDHLCRNRLCVRPDHLEPVTGRENTLRGNTLPAANLKKTHCPEEHPYDTANTYRVRGERQCRQCYAATQRRYRLRKRMEVVAAVRPEAHHRPIRRWKARGELL